MRTISLTLMLTFVASSLLSFSCAPAEDAVKRGNDFLAASHYEDAIQEYTKAIELDPEFTDAYIALANVYLLRGNMRLDENQYDLAESDYDEALRLNPNLPDPYGNLGISYYNRARGHFEGGQLVAAEADYKRALQLNPGLPDPYSDLGHHYYNQATRHLDDEQLIEAEADYKKALQLNPNLPDPYLILARAYYNRGVAFFVNREYQLAKVNIQKAVKLNPTNASYKSKLSEAETEAEAQRLKSMTTVGELMNLWHENEIAFEDKFFGKRIELLGLVESVQSRTLEPGYRVTMREDFSMVDCNLSESHRAKVANLKQGQIIEVTGTVDSGFIGPDLYDCQINRVYDVRN